MTELRASVVMDLRGNLTRQARRYEGAMRQMSTAGQRHMGRLQRVAGGLGRTLDSVGNRWVALATGAAGIGIARNLVSLEERFTRLGIQAQRSTEDMDAMRRMIFETARDPEIRADPSAITEAIEEVVGRVGDLAFAEENIRNIGMAISATGVAGRDIGGLMAEIQKMGIRDANEVLRIIDTFNLQGKEGAFALEALASLGPRVINAYTAMGRSGPEAMREMGAALQVVMRGIGDRNLAATAFQSLLATFQDSEQMRELQRVSQVQIFDPEALKEGREMLRPINELIEELVVAADGRMSLLSDFFSGPALTAFNRAVTEYNLHGEVRSLRHFMTLHGDGADTMEDSARAADTAGGALRNLSSAWQNFADINLTEHIQSAADALNSLDQETVDRWLKIAGIAAGTVGGLYALRSMGRLAMDYGRAGRALLGRSTTGGIAGDLGRTAGSMAPVPVFVTNWASMGGGSPGGRTPGRGTRKGGGSPGGRMPGRGTRKGGGYTPPATRTGAGNAPTSSPRSGLSTGAISAATRIGAVAGRATPAATTALAAHSVGRMLEDAVESTSAGQRIGSHAELARLTAREVLMEYARGSVERFLGTPESIVRIVVDQDGRVRDARAERDQDGPEIDVDLGNWRTWP